MPSTGSHQPDDGRHKPDDGRHKIETLVTAASGLGVYALALITGPLLAWKLGPDDRGSLAAVLVPTQIIGWILMFGIPQATAYFAADEERDELQATAWTVSAVAGIPIVALLWPIVPRFLAWQNHPELTVGWFRWFLIAGLLVLPYTAAFDYLRAIANSLWFNVWRSLPIVLTTLLIVVLAVADRLDLQSALAATLAGNVAGWLATLAGERCLPKPGRFRQELARRQINYGGRVWLGTLSNMVVARFDQFLMVGIVAPAELGLYVVASTAAQVSAPVAQAVAFALFPYLRADADDADASWERTRTGLIWTAAVSLVVALLLAGAGPLLIPWLLPAFAGSVAPLLLLLPGQVFWNLGNVLSAKLEADDRPGASSVALGVAAVITIIAVPAVVPIWGIRGAAVVTSCSQAAFFLVTWFAIKRHHVGPTTTGEPPQNRTDVVTAA